MAQEINIKGGKELQELLNTLPVKLERSILRGAMRAGAKVILDEAKNNVPVQSGDLRDSLRISTNARRGKVTASVRSGNKKVFYSNFVEYGTAAHSITAKSGGALSFGGVFTKSVNVAGARPKPFLRPALDTKSTEAINMIGEYIRKRLTKAGLNAPAIGVDDGE
jgi:HK97 gp10 family phage protein